MRYLFCVVYFFVNLQVVRNRESKNHIKVENMKRIFALMCVCVCLTSITGLGANVMTGDRICFLHPYKIVDGANGVKQAEPCDPLNIGGWVVTLVNNGQDGYMTIEGGLIDDVALPIKVNGSVVTLEATNEPFASVSGSKTSGSSAYSVRVDSTLNYYLVNEAWALGQGNLADVQGSILADGSIEIADGFAYYFENVKTTTITINGQSRVTTDTQRWVSMIYRDTKLVAPNGKHEYTDVETGETIVTGVFIRQSGETVYVMNLYGYGYGESYMELHSDGTVDYPGQPLLDVDNALNPAGDWYNTDGSSMGNQGNVTPAAITWGLTVPSDNAGAVAAGWRDNRLYFTDGSSFVVPGGGIRGDVNQDGNVSIADVTALIDLLLAGNEITDDIKAVADCNQDGSVSIADVTALIDYLLGGSWSN